MIIIKLKFMKMEMYPTLVQLCEIHNHGPLKGLTRIALLM